MCKKKSYQMQEACMYVLGQERLQAMQNTQQYNLLPEGPIRRMHDPERQLCSPAMPCHARIHATKATPKVTKSVSTPVSEPPWGTAVTA
jgi:hypothetical protein